MSGVVDAGLSDERKLVLEFHDAIEELASPVVPGVSVSACAIRFYLANSEQHQLECARSTKHLPPSASRAKLQMRVPINIVTRTYDLNSRMVTARCSWCDMIEAEKARAFGSHADKRLATGCFYLGVIACCKLPSFVVKSFVLEWTVPRYE